MDNTLGVAHGEHRCRKIGGGVGVLASGRPTLTFPLRQTSSELHPVPVRCTCTVLYFNVLWEAVL